MEMHRPASTSLSAYTPSLRSPASSGSAAFFDIDGKNIVLGDVNDPGYLYAEPHQHKMGLVDDFAGCTIGSLVANHPDKSKSVLPFHSLPTDEGVQENTQKMIDLIHKHPKILSPGTQYELLIFEKRESDPEKSSRPSDLAIYIYQAIRGTGVDVVPTPEHPIFKKYDMKSHGHGFRIYCDQGSI